MDNYWPMILYISCYFFILFVILEIMYYNNKLTEKIWKQFASANGLELKPAGIFSPPKVTGTYKGYDYILHIFSMGSKKSSKYTGIKVILPSPTNFELLIYRGDFIFERIAKAIGMQDIDVGDREFDNAFIIKSNMPDVAKTLLSPVMRDKLLMKKDLIHIKISDKEIRFQKGGYMKNLDDITHISDIIREIGNNLLEIKDKIIS